jgi:hypothetical protein
MAFENRVEKVSIFPKKLRGLPWQGFSGDVMGKGCFNLELRFWIQNLLLPS